jgi:hypothetical protein
LLQRMDGALSSLSMAYKIAGEADKRGAREEKIALEYTADLYHNFSAMLSSMRAYLIAVERFTPDELSRIATMPYNEMLASDEFAEGPQP